MAYKIPQLHLPMDLESKAILKKTAAAHCAMDEFKSTDKEINLLKAKAEKLWEQKKGLMQVLLTGKKRLNCDSFDFYDDHDLGKMKEKSTQSHESKKS